ncbi:hypothetical protein [Yersinia proxima]|nr:hypothetical protein [Yersinia proxima]
MKVGREAWMSSEGRLSMDATTLRSSFEQRLRWPEGLPRRGYNHTVPSAK